MRARFRASLLTAAASASLVILAYVNIGTFALGSARGRESVMEESLVDAQGNLHLPVRYRDTYQFLGSWAIAADQGQGSKALHVVYASPGTVSAYQKDGHFPDGAVLVKEVFEATTATMTTGTVSHADKLKGWFVMIRDTSDRHPGNKLWGEGWGWSWFDANSPAQTTSHDYKTDCLGCHIPARTSEWVYLSGYPPLKR